jgi:hypothetical protein
MVGLMFATIPPRRVCLVAVAAVAALWVLGLGVAPVAAQQGYGSYYGQQATAGVAMKAASPTNYLYDKYFYNRPTVSPYVNLDRLDTDQGTAYQTYVRPQQEARQRQRYENAAYLNQRKLEGRVGDTRMPGSIGAGGGTAIMKPQQKRANATPGHYHNHWYGGWNK